MDERRGKGTQMSTELIEAPATESNVLTQASNRNSLYHATHGRSSSEIAAFKNDPIEWYHWYVARDWKRAPTKAMKLGTGVHEMIEVSLPLMVALGGWETLVREIPQDVLNKDGHCKGKAWTEWQEANPAEIYFKPWEPNPLRLVWDNLMANKATREFIEKSRKEVEHFWTDEDFGPCKVKFDALAIPAFCDWKTTCKKTQREFEQDIVRRAYDLRLAFYRRGYRDLVGEEPRAHIVAINTSGGYRVAPYRIPDAWLDDAEARLILTIDEMDRFNLDEYLNSEVKLLNQPNYSKVNFDELDD